MPITRSQPLSEQVRLQILQWIQAGHPDFAENALPSEAELAELFDTSRATIREALALLERDRIVIRRQGSGTYINPALRKLHNPINELIDPLGLIESYGYRASIAFAEHQLAPIGAQVAEVLDVTPDALAVHTRVLYLADDRPAIWLEATIPVDPIRPIDAPPTHFTNLTQFAAQICGRTATHSIATLRAILAGDPGSEWLGAAAGQPLLALEDIYLTDQGRPAFAGRTLLPSEVLAPQLLRNSYRQPESVSIW